VKKIQSKTNLEIVQIKNIATHPESKCSNFCLFYYSIIVPQSDE